MTQETSTMSLGPFLYTWGVASRAPAAATTALVVVGGRVEAVVGGRGGMLLLCCRISSC
jgi:hypothetical protein